MTEEEFKLLKIGDRVRRTRGNIGTVFVLEGRVQGDPNGAPYFRAHFAHNDEPFGRAHLFYAEEIDRVIEERVVAGLCPAPEATEPPCTATTPKAGATPPSTARSSASKRTPRRATSSARSGSKRRT